MVGALAAAGASPPPVRVELLEALDRDQGHGAKFKLIRVTGRRTGSQWRSAGGGESVGLAYVKRVNIPIEQCRLPPVAARNGAFGSSVFRDWRSITAR